VYTIGKLHRLFTYDGPTPYVGAAPRQVTNAGPPWTAWTATEHWAALVDDAGRGLGVVHPGVYDFLGGFQGEPGRGGPRDDPTGYIARTRREILDHNIVYEYQYDLVVGTLEEIRAHAVARRPADRRPDYHFDRDRQHWTYFNTRDAGVPPAGALRLALDQDDPHLIGPEQWWAAEEVPKLYLRAAFHTRQARAEISWGAPGAERFSALRRLEFPIIPDGQFPTYAIDLASAPHYRGTITGLRLDPVHSGDAGDEVRIASLSWKPEPSPSPRPSSGAG
jgi:hypothetical protein